MTLLAVVATTPAVFWVAAVLAGLCMGSEPVGRPRDGRAVRAGAPAGRVLRAVDLRGAPVGHRRPHHLRPGDAAHRAATTASRSCRRRLFFLAGIVRAGGSVRRGTRQRRGPLARATENSTIVLFSALSEAIRAGSTPRIDRSRTIVISSPGASFMKVLVPVKRVVDYNVKVRVKSDGSGRRHRQRQDEHEPLRRDRRRRGGAPEGEGRGHRDRRRVLRRHAVPGNAAHGDGHRRRPRHPGRDAPTNCSRWPWPSC